MTLAFVIAVSALAAEPLTPRPPVAIGGYDAVALMTAGSLLLGDASHASPYQNQQYLFASDTNKQRFTGSPAQFAPVLAGDCPVSWLDSRQRVAGKPEYALVAHGRLHLFASAEALAAFQLHPIRYYEADLMLAGRSPVALVETGRSRPGRTEHEVVYEGRRFRLLDAREATLFLSDLGRYFPVAHGVDPVSIKTGNPEFGRPEWALRYQDRLYIFATEANRATFLTGPQQYADVDVFADGTCPVTLADTGQRERGHWGVSTIYRGARILFKSLEHRQRFLAEPAKYFTVQYAGD